MSFAFPSALGPSILVQSSQNYSDEDEQRDIYESQRHHIFSVAYYMTGDEREAETILGSTFIKGFKEYRKPTVEQLDKALMAELHSRLSFEQVPAMEADASGASLGNRNVRRTDLEEALWQLPEQERLCFLLRDVEGYAPDRIAGLLEVTEKDIQRTVMSARIRIRGLILQQRAANATATATEAKSEI
ncbi:MAG: sigma-70 family RNA polymerase sigma factor [Ktedonobacteraceae bacterium]|nr:sigma-70 family RNA polymerase sigma factor [Ktedonobacteraceae bacterium]